MNFLEKPINRLINVNQRDELMNNIIFSFIARLQPSMVRLLESLSETLRFSIFSSLFLLSLYFLSYNFLYHQIYSLFLSLHPKSKTLAHLPLSVGNHPKVVLHQLVSKQIGLWFEFHLGSASRRLWEEKWSHSIKNKNLSNLLQIGASCD